MEVMMAFSGDETIAELGALRVAVRQLLEVAQAQSIGGQFAKNALAKGVAELTDLEHWKPPPDKVTMLRTLAEASYRDLLADL
jgi:hypothetical protein